jgi:hypothetical protein
MRLVQIWEADMAYFVIDGAIDAKSTEYFSSIYILR